MHIWELKFTGLQHLYPPFFFPTILIALGLFALRTVFASVSETLLSFSKRAPATVLRSLELTLTLCALVALLYYILFAYFLHQTVFNLEHLKILRKAFEALRVI